MTQIRGKRALLTGAASGIGREIALALAREGADLLLVDVNAEGLASTAIEAKGLGVEVETRICDVTDTQALDGLVEEVVSHPRRVQLLLNVAGVIHMGNLDEMPHDQVERVLAVNLLAPIRLTQRLLPTLLEQRGCHVLNLCSLAGLVATRQLGIYSVSKFGLVGYSEVLRNENGRKLGVTAVCPGLVDTPMFESVVPDERTSRIVRRVPFLVLTPQKVADRAIRAIQKNRAVIVLSPLAKVSWFLKRLSPRLVRRY